MRELAVAIQYANKNVSVIDTINSIKMQILKMFLFNGMMKIGSIVNKNKLDYAKNWN